MCRGGVEVTRRRAWMRKYSSLWSAVFREGGSHDMSRREGHVKPLGIALLTLLVKGISYPANGGAFDHLGMSSPSQP